VNEVKLGVAQLPLLIGSLVGGRFLLEPVQNVGEVVFIRGELKCMLILLSVVGIVIVGKLGLSY